MSISTLEFARRAKDIKNKAKVNEVVKDYDAIKKLQSVRYFNFITIFTANQKPWKEKLRSRSYNAKTIPKLKD